jgi:hypothetical protein
MSADLYDDVPETEPVRAKPAFAQGRPNTRAIRSSHRYQTMHDQYREQCAVQRNPDGSIGAPCWLDGEPINYALRYPHPRSWSLDHAITVADRPDLLLDVTNWRPAHFDCNSYRNQGEQPGGGGVPSEDWDAVEC